VYILGICSIPIFRSLLIMMGVLFLFTFIYVNFLSQQGGSQLAPFQGQSVIAILSGVCGRFGVSPLTEMWGVGMCGL
jgi:hypothetical protein